MGALLVVAASAVWLVSCGRTLPGGDIPAGEEIRSKEPSTKGLEYFTGEITKAEQSIIGPKLTVMRDKSKTEKAFFITSKTEVWWGISYAKSTIQGRPVRAKVSDLKEGQRVACYLNEKNQAARIHILRQ